MWNDKEGAAGGEGLTISLSSPLQSLFQTTGLALFLSALLLLGKSLESVLIIVPNPPQ